MQAPCRPHAGHVQATCRPHASNMQATCRAHAGHMQASCRTHASNMQASCRTHAGHIQDTCRPGTRCTPSPSQLPLASLMAPPPAGIPGCHGCWTAVCGPTYPLHPRPLQVHLAVGQLCARCDLPARRMHLRTLRQVKAGRSCVGSGV